MSYYKTCPHCGAHLDPGESCDCSKDIRAQLFDEIMSLTLEERSLLLESWKLHLQFPELSTEETIKLAASGVTSTESGRAEQVTTAVSASIVPTTQEVRQV